MLQALFDVFVVFLWQYYSSAYRPDVVTAAFFIVFGVFEWIKKLIEIMLFASCFF